MNDKVEKKFDHWSGERDEELRGALGKILSDTGLSFLQASKRMGLSGNSTLDDFMLKKRIYAQSRTRNKIIKFIEEHEKYNNLFKP